MPRFLGQYCLFLIRVYQALCNPLMPRSCRFSPSCSRYTAEAVVVHGLFKGLVLGAWRVLRCNPIGGSGFDPVPRRGRWRRDR